MSQGYGSKIVLWDVSLKLRSGVTALIGPNGAGKTTLMRTVTTLAPPRSGRVFVGGNEIVDARTARRARRCIGFLPQDFGADTRFSVRDYVTYLGWLREVPRQMLGPSVERAISAVGLTDEAGTRMGKLSGGMRQRAGIAGAIVGDPDLVILDEPTVGLDPAQRLAFRRVLRSLSGRCVMLSTHLIEDVAAVADRIVILDNCAIAFDGTRDQLLSYGNEEDGATLLENGYMQFIGRRSEEKARPAAFPGPTGRARV